MAGDNISAMSEALAADPSSLVFLALAEALLARGDLGRAARIAQRGATRHSHRADAHELVARIARAQGDEAAAAAAWRAVLEIEGNSSMAHRELGLIALRKGRRDEALAHLGAAAASDPADETVRAALDSVRGMSGKGDTPGAPPEHTAVAAPAEVKPGIAAASVEADLAGDSAARLFDPILAETRQVALLLDADGLVAAGQYHTAEGRDLGAEIAGHLTGVSDEADRAMRHFKLGQWTRMAIEAEAATIAMAPVGASAVLVASPREVPLGFVRRTLERCVAIAGQWLGEGA